MVMPSSKHPGPSGADSCNFMAGQRRRHFRLCPRRPEESRHHHAPRTAPEQRRDHHDGGAQTNVDPGDLGTHPGHNRVAWWVVLSGARCTAALPGFSLPLFLPISPLPPTPTFGSRPKAWLRAPWTISDTTHHRSRGRAQASSESLVRPAKGASYEAFPRFSTNPSRRASGRGMCACAELGRCADASPFRWRFKYRFPKSASRESKGVANRQTPLHE